MDKNLSALKPALVWKHFAQIVRIPRPSSHEEKIRKYVMDFAKSRGLECKEDAAHNVYVRKPASKGMEDRKGVILQAHLDMVPQKNNDKKFDFTKDPSTPTSTASGSRPTARRSGPTTASAPRRSLPCWRTIHWCTAPSRPCLPQPRRPAWTVPSG